MRIIRTMAWLVALSSSQVPAETLRVHKTPTCGCCSVWIDHLKENDYTVVATDHNDLRDIKHEHGVDPRLQSCHTAVSEAGYVFEGHVTAGAIDQFLANPPRGAIGLSVPGMPAGTPGMEMGDRFDPYIIVQMNTNSPPTVYQRVTSKADQDALSIEEHDGS